MRDLNFDLKRLQAAHDDGSHGTRTARSYVLAQAADTLHELGFKGLRATGLRRKHMVALVREWKRQGRSIGTMKNRTAHIRWWAKRVGRPGVVPANGELGIANREYVRTIRVARLQKSFCTNTLSDNRAARLPLPFARGVDALASRVQPGIRESGSRGRKVSSHGGRGGKVVDAKQAPSPMRREPAVALGHVSRGC